MPHLLAHALATAAVTLTALLTMPVAAQAADDGPPGTAAPDCVHHYADRRYTTVVNDCDSPVSVTVVYSDGRWAPCRTLAPRDTATFAGHGFDGTQVLGLDTCLPAAS
ncbi:alpha-amylase [Streptomyces bobili]|uniref:alpha-amylase n=1 Tax=Streptomyces bobili TaxID=67280 RepID=UPI002256F561|nr:alpha-amylase [Streptomyces bobili]MCX5528447.1 alpha-amylase [Streptomyces bobili]